MSEALLARAVETKLQQWADSQDIRIAFEGVTFTPPADAIYARVKHLPATTTDAFLEGGHKALVGIWQVSVIGPVGKGVGPARVVAITLSNSITSKTVLTSGTFKVQITTPVSLGPVIEDPEGAKTKRLTIPCSFSYRADTVS